VSETFEEGGSDILSSEVPLQRSHSNERLDHKPLLSFIRDLIA
jgi:hypothetical protein